MLTVLASSPLDPLYAVIGWILALFYIPFSSLGVAIILLTIVVMAVQYPLIAKQTQSMIQMQRVQPEIKKLQQKYKDDKTKLNEELLKFYQENKVNPLAGCLPLIITFPIGIAVFRTFQNGVEKHIPQSGTFGALYRDMCTKSGELLSVQQCGSYISDYPQGQTPPAFRFLGMNLNWSAAQATDQLAGDWIEWIPYFLLIGIVIFTGWYQVRQTQARQLRQGGPQPNSQMMAITRILPIFFGVITYTLNAATTVYFVVSNVWRIGQQHFVLNKFYEKAGMAGGLAAKSGDSPPAPGGGASTKGSESAKPKTNPPKASAGPSAHAARRKRKRKR
ncbi:MAG: YidC/Oxa1 family membrane protein insertase [Actinomycetota bacterium]